MSTERESKNTIISASAASSPPTHASRWLGGEPLLASCLWGGMYVVSRATFDVIPPVTLGALRVAIGGLTLAFVLQLVNRRSRGVQPVAGHWRRRDHLHAVGLGALVACTIVTQFIGTNLASAHEGALLTTATPIFVVPLAWALLGERPRTNVIGGTLLAVVGVVAVVAVRSPNNSSGANPNLLGDGLLVLSSLCWALFTVVGAPLTRRFSALAASTVATLWSIPFLFALVPFELTTHPLSKATQSWGFSTILAVLYLSWGATSLAWFLWYRGVARLDAGIVAVYFFAQPLVGGLLSGVFLGLNP